MFSLQVEFDHFKESFINILSKAGVTIQSSEDEEQEEDVDLITDEESEGQGQSLKEEGQGQSVKGDGQGQEEDIHGENANTSGESGNYFALVFASWSVFTNQFKQGISNSEFRNK